MSTTDIQEQIEQIYGGVRVDSSIVSNITNTLINSIKEWKSRLLENVCFVVWMDKHTSSYFNLRSLKGEASPFCSLDIKNYRNVAFIKKEYLLFV